MRRYECLDCGMAQQILRWDTDPPVMCERHGAMVEVSLVLSAAPNRGVIDDQLEGGARFFENMGPEPVYLESKSQWRKEVEKRNLVNVVRHDSAYYAKQRKLHDERLRDTGRAE
jgi:hypothetical protein